MGLSSRIAKAVVVWRVRKLKNRGFKTASRLLGPIKKVSSALQKEITFSAEVHQEVLGALERMKAKNPQLEKVLNSAFGYAVFPTVGKATAVLGGAFGRGEVFEKDRVIGYAGLVQVTLGLQIGGQTYHELLIFENRHALDAFKRSKVAFAANASAVMIKAGASAARGSGEARALVFSEGGMMAEAGIGAQKFIFKSAALGRLRKADTSVAQDVGSAAQGFLENARAKAAAPPPIQPPS